ncbi:MAG: alpha-hydroxy-acid oxidizing protein [Deltaproteobacteria bacterium]|nr:alpha-hydroxy-acid oxidizing protein [Deltaproteobacteria bacterium]
MATQLEPNRRSLLRWLLASPLLLVPRPVEAFEHLLAAAGESVLRPDEVREIIAAARDAINVFDFEPVAERNLSPAHYTYLSMGVQHEVTLRANRSAFDLFKLRPRRLVDVREVDTSMELLGTKLSSPIVLAPVGSQKAFHPEGELAVARAARSRDHLQILSTSSSTELEEVVDARGAPIWFQLYTPGIWPATRMQLREAEEAGCPAVALTVDNMSTIWGQNRDRIRRYRRDDNAECQSCHQSFTDDLLDGTISAARAVGFDLGKRFDNMMILDWDYLDRIRDATSMKLLVKGIVTREDASLCIEHGVDGIVVSNHGGRAVDSGLSTIEALPPIVEEVGGRIPILVDSGFRRGTDVFKALALGADAVCVGRPYLWGLAAFGQEGVEAVLGILRSEFETTMKGMGTVDLASIGAEHVLSAGPACQVAG